jgi:hypothetical protein
VTDAQRAQVSHLYREHRGVVPFLGLESPNDVLQIPIDAVQAERAN